MQLSNYIDTMEKNQVNEYVNRCNLFIHNFKKMYGIDLFEVAKTNDPKIAFEKVKDYLFFSYQSQMNNCLLSIGYDKFEYEKSVISQVIISICKNCNAEMLIQKMIEMGIFIDVKDKDGWIEINSSHGLIMVKSAIESFNDNKIISEYIEQLKNNNSLLDGCHDISYFLIQNDPKLRAITGVSTRSLGHNFYHSVVVDQNDLIIDIPNDIIMPRDTYYNFFRFKPINEVTYEECVTQDKECKDFDESKTLFKLLRIAAYKECKQGKK